MSKFNLQKDTPLSTTVGTAGWISAADLSGEGVNIDVADLSTALPVGNLVLNLLDGEIYRSTNAVVPTYTQVTNTGGGGSFTGIQLIQAGGTITNYGTIATALGASVSGDVVVIYPGTYNESVSIPAGVRLVGYPNALNCIIAGADATSTRVTIASGGTLREVTVVAPSAGANPAVDCSGMAAFQLAVIRGVVFQAAGGTGPLFTGPGAGLVAFTSCRHNGGTVNGTAFLFDGGGSAYIQELLFGVGTSTVALEIGDCDVNLQTCTYTPAIYNATTGIYISNANAKLQGSGILFPDFGTFSITNAIRIGADGCKVSLTSSHLHAATYGLLVDGGLLGTNTEFTLIGELRFEEISAPSGWLGTATVLGLIVDDGVQNDPATRLNETTVGTIASPSELAVGTGDSVIPVSVWTYDASAGTYTDVTAEAQSRTGSTFVMPGDIGDRLYVGHSLPFVNVKPSLTVLAVPGAGVIQERIWTGAGYENIRTMASDADAPYAQSGDTSLSSSLNEQVRLDIEGDADPTSGTFGEPYSNWATEDPMGAGTAYYYLVFEVQTANLTTPPTFERIKCGFNRFEANKDGFNELFGAGQGQRKALPASPRRSFTGGGSPGNGTFNLSANVTITIPLSVFSNNSVEGFAQTFFVRRGIDTSRQFVFTVEWIVPTTTTGDVELEVIASIITPAANVNAGTLTEQALTRVTTVTAANYNGVLNVSNFYLSFPEAVDADQISVSVFRDATAGNPDDTLAGNIQVFDTVLRAVHWTGF